MKKLRFITGGARSGKSTYAEKLTKSEKGKTVYIATAVPFDEGMQDRIKKHQEQRPSEWKTIEQYKNFFELINNPDFLEADNILFDCMTIMLMNQLMDRNINWETISMDEVNAIEAEITQDVIKLLEILKEKNTIIVSNEIGLGIVPADYFTRYFRDMLGRLNQLLAQKADEVYLTVSGIPLKIK